MVIKKSDGLGLSFYGGRFFYKFMWHKYKAKKTEVSGEAFPSKLEGAVYSLLLLRKKAGEISEIKRQGAVRLTPSISWKVDFECVRPDGTSFFCEAKGIETEGYSLKKRLWKDFGKTTLEIWKGSYQKPFLHETLSAGNYSWRKNI